MGRGQSLGHRWQQGSTTSARTSFVKRWVFASYFQRLLCAVESIRHMPPIMSIMPPMSTPGNGLPPPPPTCDWSPGLGTPRKPPHQSRQSHPYPGSRPFCRPFGLQACRHRQNRQARWACLGGYLPNPPKPAGSNCCNWWLLRFAYVRAMVHAEAGLDGDSGLTAGAGLQQAAGVSQASGRCCLPAPYVGPSASVPGRCFLIQIQRSPCFFAASLASLPRMT